MVNYENPSKRIQRISLDYAQKKNVLDILAELMEYGVTEET